MRKNNYSIYGLKIEFTSKYIRDFVQAKVLEVQINKKPIGEVLEVVLVVDGVRKSYKLNEFLMLLGFNKGKKIDNDPLEEKYEDRLREGKN